MFTLGFAFGYHDAGIAVLKNQEILGVYSEERFSRIKHDSAFPSKALDYAFKRHQITTDKISSIYYYENPALKLLRIAQSHKTSEEFWRYLMVRNKGNNLKNPIEKISEEVGVSQNIIKIVDHHISHLFSSLTMIEDNFINDDTYGLVIDGVGEFDTITGYKFCQQDGNFFPEKIFSSKLPNSLGLFYAAVTAFLGFEVNEAEYRVMGLAAYGEPTYIDDFLKIVAYDEKRGIILDTEYFDFEPRAIFPYSPAFIQTFGLPSSNSDNYVNQMDEKIGNRSDDFVRFSNIAASAQLCLTTRILDLINKKFPSNMSNLIYSGGVALNSKTNQEIYSKIDLRIIPDPGDGGNSLGAAAAGIFQENAVLAKFNTPYLGFDIGETNSETIRSEFKDWLTIEEKSNQEIYDAAVNSLANGEVIAWAQDRAEFGPRALGNRSILANPSISGMKDQVNKAVKFRERFRPFAPSILAEEVANYFELDSSKIIETKNSPLKYMLVTLTANDIAKDAFSACVHEDGTSRVQVVFKKDNPKYYSLLTSFYNRTGIPGLLNTSFNIKGDPIVNTLTEAIESFKKMNINTMFVNNLIIRKNNV